MLAAFNRAPSNPFAVQVVVLLTACLAVFTPVLQANWLWDDTELILKNDNLHSLAGLGKIWLGKDESDYWPLTYTLFWVEWPLFGGNPLGYHLTNLALHLLAGFLLWQVLERLGLRWAWLGALLFLIHPLAVESVMWVSEEKNTLSLVFALLSWKAYLNAESGKGRYHLAFIYFLAAMLAKTSVVMLPVTLLLYAWWRKSRIESKTIARVIPFFLLTLLLGWITYLFQTAQPSPDVIPHRGFLERLVGADTAFYFYLGKFLYPAELIPVYPPWPFPPYSPGLLLMMPLLLFLLAGLLFLKKNWAQTSFFALGFFGLNIFPVLGLISLSYGRVSPVADHFMYLPMIGLIALFVAAAQEFYQITPENRRWLIRLALTSLTFLLMWTSYSYSKVFFNDITMWTYTAEHNPRCREAQNQVGIYEFQGGHMEKALEHFQKSLQISPTYSPANNNLGYLLELQGKFAEARKHYELAHKIDSGNEKAVSNLARLDKLKPVGEAPQQH